MNNTNGRRWSLDQNLPRKGSDEVFDLKLEELGLVGDLRKYTSRCWLLFKKLKGIYPAPSLQLNKKDLLLDFENCLYGKSDEIFNTAFELLLKTVPNASNLFAFVNLDDVNLFKHYGGGPLRERACNEVTQLNCLLASSLQHQGGG
jgi:hypothetical protein